MEKEKKTVLLVDDDVYVHGTFDAENPFEDKINVLHFYSSKDALNYLRTNKVHLIISCIRFPAPGDIDGIHFLRECKELYPRLPFIMHTAYPRRDDFSVWASDAYIVKSSDYSELFKAVEKLLGLTICI
jgi:DNA-binding NarL/FixJ family response regulator